MFRLLAPHPCRCRIRIGKLIVVIAVDANDIRRSPRIEISARSQLPSAVPMPDRGFAEFFTSGGLDKNDLPWDWPASPHIHSTRCMPRSSIKQIIVCGLVSPRSIGVVIGRCAARKRILSVFGVERVHGVHDLSEIVFRLRLSGLVLNCFESGKEQTDQNRNDCDNNQQLDESEGTFVSLGRTHGANASRKLNGAHVKSLKKLHGYETGNVLSVMHLHSL